MTYIIAGVLSSVLMLLYRRAPGRTSPLHGVNCAGKFPQISRLNHMGDRVTSYFGLVASFLVLFFLAANRYGIGTDYWLRHIPVFLQIQAGYAANYEPGFVLINSMVGKLTSDPQWLIATISFLTIFLVYRFILRMSLNPALSVLLFVVGGFYLEVFNLAQQGLAIAILLNTIELALRKKHITFIACTLVAATIHSSALIWFAIWPLLLFRTGRKVRIVLILAASIVVMSASGVILDIIAGVAPDYAWYLTSDYGTAQSISAFVVVLTFTLLVVTLILVPRAFPHDHYSESILNLQAVSVILLLGSVTIAYFFSRLIYFFTPIQMLILPLLLASVKSRVGKALTLLGFLALFFASFTHQFLIWNAHGVVPYESVSLR